MSASPAKALIFDVFGTVVDWRGSIIGQCQQFGARKRISADWDAFADAWRGRYQPYMNKVRDGELPWTNLDGLHRMMLEDTLAEFEIGGLSQDEMAEVTGFWHRLHPWPDSVAGLYRLKHQFIIAPMSNGNVSMMTNMAKFAGLPWDCILGAELARHYKPDPESYLTAVQLLGMRPEEVVMTAAHQNDLLSAQKVGLRAAFVPRPMERGPGRTPDPTPDPSFNVVATDFVDLAEKMRALA